MGKRPFVIFGLVAAVFGGLIPYLVIENQGTESPVASVPASQERGKTLFQQSCGACHTLARAATGGVVGPNLDDLLGLSAPEARRSRVAAAIERGGTGVGKMPAGILEGADARRVAAFVARVAR